MRENSVPEKGSEAVESLYQYIASAAVDGALPKDFLLSRIGGENEIHWMDGAMDGVAIYHMGPQKMAQEEEGLMAEALQAASRKEFQEADDMFSRLGQKAHAISVIDHLQRFILEKKGELSLGNLYEYAVHAISDATDRECVKFGLSILELFRVDKDEETKDIIRTLGLSDEFSVFCIFVMGQWEKGNEEIFHLAKKVHGWGRVHAVEHIEPETEEIKKWLLLEGVHNDIMWAYSALNCWEKSDAEEALRGGISREEFTGIRDIMEGLLEEGPCAGISAVENGTEMIALFLEKAKGMELALEDYEVIRDIRIYCEEKELPAVKLCVDLLDSEECRNLVGAEVKQGRALDLARDLGIDYKDHILRLMETAFDKYYHMCSALTEEPEYMQKVLEVFRKNLPLGEMKTAPTLSMGLGEAYQRQQQLEIVVQQLREYPLEGKDFVETALQSAPIRTRNQGLAALQEWVKRKEMPLEKLLPDMYELLGRLREVEVDGAVKERMDKLLEGMP